MTRTQEMFCFAAVQVESGAEKLRPLFVLIAGVASARGRENLGRQ